MLSLHFGCSSGSGAAGLDPSRAIGGGQISQRLAVVGILDVKGLGTGTFVRDRCVLTAAHAVNNDSPVVVQIAGAGDGVDGTEVPWEGGLRVARLPDVALDPTAGDPSVSGYAADLAFIWIDRDLVPSAPPHILEYDPLPVVFAPFDYGDPDRFGDGDVLTIPGLGPDCSQPDDLSNLQREADFDVTAGLFPTTADVPLVQTAGRPTIVDYASLSARTCGGDSGAPLLVNEEVRGVHVAVPKNPVPGPLNISVGVSLWPFQEWLEDHLRLFCEPWFIVQIKTWPGRAVAVTGTARGTVAPADGTTIIDCDTRHPVLTPADCTQGLLGSLHDGQGLLRSELLVGTGEVVLAAQDMPELGRWFFAWEDGGPDEPCPCAGALAGVAFQSAECRIPLVARGDPGATEQQLLSCTPLYRDAAGRVDGP
jgi:hypothetical protein